MHSCGTIIMRKSQMPNQFAFGLKQKCDHSVILCYGWQMQFCLPSSVQSKQIRYRLRCHLRRKRIEKPNCNCLCGENESQFTCNLQCELSCSQCVYLTRARARPINNISSPVLNSDEYEPLNSTVNLWCLFSFQFFVRLLRTSHDCTRAPLTTL